jgi:serine/threonine-protein phosphatase 2A regulatory subunit B
MFDRSSKKEVTLEASRDVAKPKTMLKPRKVQDAGFLIVFELDKT